MNWFLHLSGVTMRWIKSFRVQDLKNFICPFVYPLRKSKSSCDRLSGLDPETHLLIKIDIKKHNKS